MLKTTCKPEDEVAYSGVTAPTPTGSRAEKVIDCGCVGLAVLHVVDSVKVVPFVVMILHDTCNEFEPTMVLPTYPYAVF